MSERLRKLNTNVADILGSIEINENVLAVFAYTSHFEGLGTETSDIDVYVVVNSVDCIDYVRETQLFRVNILLINDANLDVEYITIEDFECSIKLLREDPSKLCISTIKALNKIRVSDLLYSRDDNKSGFHDRIEVSKLKEATLKHYMIAANSSLQDAIALFREGEHISSLELSRTTLKHLLGALNTANDSINLTNKWIEKIFVVNGGYGYLQRYLDCVVYNSISAENIESAVEDMIELAQDIISGIYLESF